MKATVPDYLNSYHRHEIRTLKKSLHKATEGSDKKAIHELRVSVKKLKAFYKLIENLYPRRFDATKHIRPFHKVFESAGAIREIQVNKELLKDYPFSSGLLKEYRHYLGTIEKAAHKSLKKSISTIRESKQHACTKEISALCKHLKNMHFNKECTRLIQKQSGKIAELRSLPLTTKILHQIRKHLKQVAYVINIQQKSIPGTYSQNFIKDLKQTEVMIGKWHDRAILIASLKDYKKQSHSAVIKTLKGIIDSIEHQNRKQAQLLKPKIDLLVKTCLNL